MRDGYRSISFLFCDRLAHRIIFETFAPHKGDGTIIGFIVALVSIAIYQYVTAGNRRREAEWRETALVTRREEQINAPLEVIHVDGVVRKPSEMFYASEEAEVISEHSHSHHVGGYGGISVPIGHGVRVNTGRSRGRSVQTTAVEVDDRGMLYVSDQRVLFVGVRHTIEIPLLKIVALQDFEWAGSRSRPPQWNRIAASKRVSFR